MTVEEARNEVLRALGGYAGAGQTGRLVAGQAFHQALDAYRDAVAARAREEGAREAQAENARLREALEQFANEDNWRGETEGFWCTDNIWNGANGPILLARNALAVERVAP
jgi:hypothetical protein